jgi:hypothetical protein
LEAAGGERLAVAGGSMTASGWWRMTERKRWVEGNQQQQRVATPPPEHEVMNKIEISRGPRGLGTQGGWQRIAIFGACVSNLRYISLLLINFDQV